MRRLSIKVAFPLLLALSSSVAVACGDNNEPPSDEDGPTDIGNDGGGEPGSGGAGDGSGATSADGAGGGSGGGSDGSGNSGNAGGEGGQNGSGGGSGGGFEEPDAEDCSEEPNGTFPGEDNPVEGEDCWDHSECKGVASEQFLNRCSGTCLQPFDNEERIVGFDGNLPPL